MSTNSKFKAGDKVVCVDAGNFQHTGLEMFKSYTVGTSNRNSGSVTVDSEVRVCFDPNRFVHERDFTLACINHLLDKRIELELFTNDSDDFFYKCHLNYSAKYYSTVQLLDALYPTETPQQKKLKELEDQQRKIAAEMQALRESMS